MKTRRTSTRGCACIYCSAPIGMAGTAGASTALRSAHHAQPFRFEIVDAQQIPFEADMFDAVIANHMLYHVPDRARALSEMHRMMKLDSLVYLATDGRSHLRELHELEQRFDHIIDLE